MPSDLKLAGLDPKGLEAATRAAAKVIGDRHGDSIEYWLGDARREEVEAAVHAYLASLPAPTELSREVERLTSELDEARKFGCLGCDANAGGPHEIIKEGSYQFCGKCGETIRQASLRERARAAEARAEAAESQLSREAQSRDEVVEECAKMLQTLVRECEECGVTQVPAETRRPDLEHLHRTLQSAKRFIP